MKKTFFILFSGIFFLALLLISIDLCFAAENCPYPACQNENPVGCQCGSVVTKGLAVWCCAVDNKTANSKGICESFSGCAPSEGEEGDGVGDEDNGDGGSYGSLFELKNPLAADTLPELIDRFITLIFLIGIVVAPIMFLIGGFYFMTASGDPIKLDKAKKTMLYAAIGLGIVLLAKALVALIEDLLGVKETTYFKNLWFFGTIGIEGIKQFFKGRK